jgi:hypothetical protein
VDLHAEPERESDTGRAGELGDDLEDAGVDAGARIVVAHGLAAEFARDPGDPDREPALAVGVGGCVRRLAEGDRGYVGLVDLGADLELCEIGQRQDRWRRGQRDERPDLGGAPQDHTVGRCDERGLIERDLRGIELGLRKRDRGGGFLDLFAARALRERLGLRSG